MKSIGIDIGTTTISIIVMNTADFTIEEYRTLDNGAFLPSSRPWERIQDVSGILRKTQTALEEILDRTPDISSIGLTGQMHGIVYVDQAGTAVSPLYTWQDGRGNQPDFRQGKSVCACLSEDYGVKAASGYGMVTHLYNVQKGLVPRKAVSFCTISDYLGMALTGRSLPLLHISQAASLGLYDCRTHTFQEEILREHNALPPALPCITPDLLPLGYFRGILVGVSVGDNQASFLGSVRDAEHSLLVNIGTGSQISMLSDRYCEAPGIESRPLTRDAFLLAGSALCGGLAFAALERFFREYAAAAGAPDVPQFETMKRFLEGTDLSADCWNVRTTFSGTREHPADSGSVTGIRLENFHPASLIRGTLNGMAEELYTLYTNIIRETSQTKTRLIASGNGIRKNPALRQILESRFQMPLEIVPHQEEAAIGAAVASLAAAKTLSLNQWLGLATGAPRPGCKQ